MKIIEYSKQFENGVVELINKLHPKWFDRNALENIPKDIQIQKCFIAIDEDNTVLGFISIFSKDGIGQIGWLGVNPEYFRQGIGKRLLLRAENLLKNIGIDKLKVETVVEMSPQDGTYDKTIEFYYAQNFEIEEKFNELEDNGFKYRMGILKKELS